GVEVLQHAGDKIINAVRAHITVLDQFGVARETHHADDRLHALVDRREPPTARAAHAHAARADLRRVDVRTRHEIIEQALFIAHLHAPERAPEPQVDFAEGHFLRGLVFNLARGTAADAVAVKVTVDRRDDV